MCANLQYVYKSAHLIYNLKVKPAFLLAKCKMAGLRMKSIAQNALYYQTKS